MGFCVVPEAVGEKVLFGGSVSELLVESLSYFRETYVAICETSGTVSNSLRQRLPRLTH